MVDGRFAPAGVAAEVAPRRLASRWPPEFVHRLSFTAIAVGISLLVSSAAVACQCAPLSLAARIDHADLVLVATVSSFEALDHVIVQPVEVFKGFASKSLTIQTGRSDCDFFFPPVNPTVGEEYLLYLEQTQVSWIASRCLASGAAVEKATELHALRVKFKSNTQPNVAADPLQRALPARW